MLRMKIPYAYSRLRAAKGFTLMEVLIVMVIIVVLATMTISIYTWLETRKSEQTAEAVVRRVTKALDSYHTDVGEYPYGTESPFRNNGVAVADGDEYSSNVVYMALFGDYKNEGVPDRDAVIYDPELNPSTQPQNNPTVREIKLTNKKGRQVKIYILADPWGLTYRYRLGHEQPIPNKNPKSSKVVMGKGVNPDFDFWSFGKDSDCDLDNYEAKENEDNISNMPEL